MAEGSRTLGELGESGADALADLAAVDRPIEQARGLPNWLYTTAAGWSLERERLFAPTWACVGFGKDVPAPGDVRPVDLMGLPLILLRDHAGEIRVFHNVCSHRGLELVTEPCRVKHHLRCPYHSWTYGLDGSLTKTPMIGGPGRNDCPGFDRSRHGLKPVRSAVWFDVVFVNLSGTAPDFADHVAPLAENYAGWREIFAEDQEVVERMQRGRASPAYQGGAFSPAMDGPTHCFHRWVARQLMVTAPSAVAAE